MTIAKQLWDRPRAVAGGGEKSHPGQALNHLSAPWRQTVGRPGAAGRRAHGPRWTDSEMDGKVESWVAARKLIEKHGAAAYDCALRHEIRSEAEGRDDLATIWRMVKDAILEVRQSA